MHFKLLLSFFLLLSPSNADPFVVRQNVGTVFQKLHQLEYEATYWRTFIRIPVDLDRIDLFQVPDCSTAIPRLPCHKLSTAMSALNDVLTRFNIEVGNLTELLNFVIPEKEQSTNNTRGKRAALFPTIGHWFHSLLGLMDQNEQDILDSKLEKIISTINNNRGSMGEMHSTFTHYATVNNAEIQRLNQHDNNTDFRLNYLTADIQKLVNSTAQLELYTDSLYQAIIADISTFTTIFTATTFLARFASALGKLQQGRLPMALVPPQDLRAILDTIEQLVKIHHQNFRLVHTDTRYFYRYGRISFSRTQESIYIVLYIPIEKKDATFQLYKLRNFAIPTSASADNFTLVKNLPDFFAISMASHFSLSTSDLQTCNKQDSYFCTVLPRKKSITDEQDCVSSIFLDDSQAIMKYCKFQVLASAPRQTIDLQDGLYYLINHPEPHFLLCDHDAPQQLSGCMNCLLQLNCTCSLKSHSLYIPARFINCNMYTKTIRTFGFNFALLAHIVPDMKFGNLSASTQISMEPELKFPQLRTLAKSHLSELSNIVAKSKSQTRSPAIDYEFPTSSVVSGFSLSALVTISLLVGYGYLLSRIRTLSAMILAMERNQALALQDALDVTHFYALVSPPTPATPTIRPSPTPLTFIIDLPFVYWLPVLLMIATFLGLFLFFIYRIYTARLTSASPIAAPDEEPLIFVEADACPEAQSDRPPSPALCPGPPPATRVTATVAINTDG